MFSFWSLNSLVIKNLCRFHVAAIKKGVYEYFVSAITLETFLCVIKKGFKKDRLAIENIVTLLQEINEARN